MRRHLIRVHSGVAHIAREIVINTCHHYNYVQIAGAINHPEKGKKLDISQDTNDKAGIEDSSVILYPIDGYGNPDFLRQIIKLENPDAILLITDPRYFTWLFQIENEIRRKIPITYLNIWDSLPAPQYNREYYESCDLLMSISKQTKNINKLVLDGGNIPWMDLDNFSKPSSVSSNRTNPILLKYVPHGLNSEIFKPIDSSNKELQDFKKQLFRGKDYEFVLFFNSRNIRRKSIPDTILAWKLFIDKLPKDKAEKCLLLLHTDVISDSGTDLPAVIKFFFPDENPPVLISSQRYTPEQMNLMYNCTDGVILLSSAEGWGLSLTESLLTGKPFIANVTGGMQDQMRFEDKNKKWIDFNSFFPSNHRGTYKKHGKWAFPVFPTKGLSVVGSPPTPYIFDDRCSFEDATLQITNLYNLSKEERQYLGKLGLEWALSDEAGFTSKHMSERVIKCMDHLFDNWEPRKKFEFYKDTDFYPRVINHEIIY